MPNWAMMARIRHICICLPLTGQPWKEGSNLQAREAWHRWVIRHQATTKNVPSLDILLGLGGIELGLEGLLW